MGTRRGRFAGWLVAVCLGSLAGCAAKVQAPPEPPGTVRKAEEAFRLREYDRAAELYLTYARLIRRDPYVPRVLYKAALAQFQIGRYEDALATLRDLEERYPNRRWVQVEALRGDVEAALQHPLAAIHAWDGAFAVARPGDESKLRLRVATLAAKLGEQELRDAAESATAKPVREILLAQLAQREHPEIPEPLPEFAGTSEEESELGEPTPELAGAAEKEGTSTEGSLSPPPPGVGVAQEVLPRDIRVGILADVAGGSDWVEAVKWVLGDEAVVSKAALAGDVGSAWDELVGDPSIAAVFVGGEISDPELADRARRRAVPVIDLRGGEVSGPYWIQAGVSPASALPALLDYAVQRARLRRFGVVYPDNVQGRRFFAQAREELARRGATIVGSDAYNPDARSLTAGLVRRWRERDNLQALLLSDSVTAAATFARFLQGEMPDIPLLGVEDWSTLAELVPGVSGVLFVAPVFLEGPDAETWAQEFEARVGRPPAVQAVVAYEAASWFRDVAAECAEGTCTRDQLWQAMLSPRVVRGVSGEVEVREQRFVRQPVVVQFTRGQLERVPSTYVPSDEEAAATEGELKALP